MDDLLLWGPPGTGKTTSGLNWLEGRIEAGADIYRAAFVSFTNAAVDEAKARLGKRFGVDPGDLPYCRTLHALCKRALGISHRGWLADDRLREFGKEFGYDLKSEKSHQEDDLDQKVERSGRDAPLLEVWDFGRQRLIFDAGAAWRAFAAYQPAGVAFAPFARFLAFVRDYEAWKRREALRDMADLLCEFLEHPVALNVSVAVTDEAQDLSPLMWAVNDRLFANAEYRGVLGDDDQALYSFSGAAPELLNRRQAREKVKLRHSYRLSEASVRTARTIIEQNVNREPKEFESAGHAGEVRRAYSLADLDLLGGQSWFLQVRNWRLCDQMADSLEAQGIPYLVRGSRRHSPWRSEHVLRAVRAIVRLRAREAVTLTDLWSLTKFSHSARGKEPGIWAWGAKSKLGDRAANEPGGSVQWSDLGALGMTAEGVGALLGAEPFAVLTREVRERDLGAYTTALRAGTLLREARIELGSCHAFKGAEADCSVTLAGCTGGPYRALFDGEKVEEERRVAYVAMTRARVGSYVVPPRPEHGVYPWEVLGV